MVEGEAQEEVVEVEGVVAVASVLRGHPEVLSQTEDLLDITVIETESTIITLMVLPTQLLRKTIALQPA